MKASVGTVYLVPTDGSIYRLRSYDTDFSDPRAIDPAFPPTVPNYAVLTERGMTSVSSTLPDEAIIIWTPDAGTQQGTTLRAMAAQLESSEDRAELIERMRVAFTEAWEAEDRRVENTDRDDRGKHTRSNAGILAALHVLEGRR